MQSDRQSLPTDKRTSTRSILVVLLLVVSLLLPMYFGAYRILGTRSIDARMEAQVYRHEWQATVFRPAARFESLIRQKTVETANLLD